MADESLPKIIFKHQKIDGLSEQIEVILNEQGSLRQMNKDMKCETSTKRMDYRLMKSFTPLSIAMNEQTVETKQLRNYVQKYVSRLTV